jgi:hypothetical protein
MGPFVFPGLVTDQLTVTGDVLPEDAVLEPLTVAVEDAWMVPPATMLPLTLARSSRVTLPPLMMDATTPSGCTSTGPEALAVTPETTARDPMRTDPAAPTVVFGSDVFFGSVTLTVKVTGVDTRCSTRAVRSGGDESDWLQATKAVNSPASSVDRPRLYITVATPRMTSDEESRSARGRAQGARAYALET